MSFSLTFVKLKFIRTFCIGLISKVIDQRRKAAMVITKNKMMKMIDRISYFNLIIL